MKGLQHNQISIYAWADVQAKKVAGKLDLEPVVSLDSDIIETG